MPPLLEGGVASPRRSWRRAAKVAMAMRLAQLEELARDATRAVRDVDGAPVESYRCQATEALRAAEPLSKYDLGQYIRELTSGNVGLLRFLRVAVRGLSSAIRRRLRLLGDHPLPYQGVRELGPAVSSTCSPATRWRCGQREEIAPTIDESGRTRGLGFDWEMIPYCGGRYRVKDRVERIIDERTGQMIEISSDCLILDGVVCSGEHSSGRWFCPRAIYPYWREAWLRRGRGCRSFVLRRIGCRTAHP